ncbi:unnamed protein product, partial [Owenia fusiformis]
FKMSPIYPGSRFLLGYNQFIGISIDELNFLVGQVICLVFAFLFRRFLHHSKVSTDTRHITAFSGGIIILWFCHGIHSFHLITQALVSYAIILYFPPEAIRKVVFLYAMGHLCVVHIYRLIVDYDATITIEITGPLMISTQKVITVAFTLHDGRDKSPDRLSDDQKRHAISKPPTLIEYLGYYFSFQNILCGPLCYYQDYDEFIKGTNYNRTQHPSCKNSPKITRTSEPSPLFEVMRKVALICIFAGSFHLIVPIVPIVRNVDPEFMRSHSRPFRTIYLFVSYTIAKHKYYFAMLSGEAISNASGLGFNGYDETGKAHWDLVSPFRLMKMELATSTKEIVDSWNIQCALWFRRISYDRVPYKETWKKTFCTLMLSAVWHGFYPGYYLSFTLAALTIEASRKLRRLVRHHFTDNKHTKLGYDIFTWCLTQFGISYWILPFPVQKFWPSIHFFNDTYWFMHITLLVILLLLPNRRRESPKSKDNGVSKVDINLNQGNHKAHYHAS